MFSVHSSSCPRPPTILFTGFSEDPSDRDEPITYLPFHPFPISCPPPVLLLLLFFLLAPLLGIRGRFEGQSLRELLDLGGVLCLSFVVNPRHSSPCARDVSTCTVSDCDPAVCISTSDDGAFLESGR